MSREKKELVRLQSNGIVVTYSGPMVFDISLKAGAVLGLVGENGVGKTTLLQYFKNKQRDLFPAHYSVGFLDQQSIVPLGDLRVIDAFLMLQECFSYRCKYQDVSEYILIDQLQFRNKMGDSIRSLSGGENQILKILLLFFLKTNIYFLDEPSHSLDTQRLKILSEKILLTSKEEVNVSFFIIDHNLFFLHDLHAELLKMFVGESEIISLERNNE